MSEEDIKLANMKKQLTIFLSLVLIYLMGHAENIEKDQKIDPVFRALIEAEKKSRKLANRKDHFKEKRKNLSYAEKEKYECIVYTKNANALKDKGIVIHSILPTFITSVAFLTQIEQMAEMPEVTYIEASKLNYPTHRNLNTILSIQ